MAKCSHQKLGNRKTLRSWAGVRCRGLASPEGILHTGAVESQDPKRCWAGAGTSSAQRCPPGTAALASWSGSLTRGLPVSCSTRTEPAFSDELVPTMAAEGTGSPPCQITHILAQQCSKKSSSRARSSPAQLGPIFQESCPTPHRKLSFRQDYKLNRPSPAPKAAIPKVYPSRSLLCTWESSGTGERPLAGGSSTQHLLLTRTDRG